MKTTQLAHISKHYKNNHEEPIKKTLNSTGEAHKRLGLGNDLPMQRI